MSGIGMYYSCLFFFLFMRRESECSHSFGIDAMRSFGVGVRWRTKRTKSDQWVFKCKWELLISCGTLFAALFRWYTKRKYNQTVCFREKSNDRLKCTGPYVVLCVRVFFLLFSIPNIRTAHILSYIIKKNEIRYNLINLIPFGEKR